MNVLCLFQKFDFRSSTIYLDLIYALRDAGHKVMIAACSSDEGNRGCEERDGVECAYIPVPDQFGANKIKKGLIQLMIGRKILKGVKKYFWGRQVDIIIYPTPPVTLSGILKPLKKHYGAVNYLMLKDIFPQNAVDLKMMREGGLLHRLFKGMEGELYRESDRIGCMSKANIEYIKQHQPEVDTDKLELFPNTVKVLEEIPGQNSNTGYRDGGGDDSGSYVNFFFGGNLGQPQAVDFLLKGIASLSDVKEARFTFIGTGTEEKKIRSYIEEEKPDNLKLLNELPRREYEELLKKADVGIVSLSPHFTIPNYPSRILSYMQTGKAVFAVTDRNTDIRELVTKEARCGFWCPSDDLNGFRETVKRIVSEREKLKDYGMRGREYLIRNFNVENSVKILENAAESRKGA